MPAPAPRTPHRHRAPRLVPPVLIGKGEKPAHHGQPIPFPNLDDHIGSI